MSNINFLLDSSKSNGSASDFTVYLHSPIDFHNMQHEVALIQLNLWNTWANISSSYDNNVFTYFNGTDWQNITIPDGNYSIQSLEKAIHEGMKENGDFTADVLTGSESYHIKFSPNYSTIKLKIELSGGYQVDFTSGKLRLLLGFDAVVLSTSAYGVNNVDINNGVTEIHLRCSMINAGMYNNNITSDVLYSFVPAAPPGGSLMMNADPVVYLPIRDNRYLDSIRLYLTDQSGRSLTFIGGSLAASLHIQPRKLIERI